MTEPAMFTHTDAEGDALVIRDGGTRGALVDMVNVDGNDGVYVNADEAPAIALALLKTAGIEPSEDGNPLEVAALFLAEAVAELDEALKESDEALEAEALALFNAATDSCYVFFPNELVRETWMKTARRARELHAPAPEPEPRFVARTAPKKPAGYWIVHDTETGRVYPFGVAIRSEELANRAARELEAGDGLYCYDPATTDYL